MNLDTFRSDKSYWNILAFSPRGKVETWEDQNFRARFRVAIWLQYDLRPEDSELLKYMLEQEILFHLDSPFQGLTESLEIVAWLLARERNVLNIPLFVQAKFANFDTNCGFDIEHVFSAGYQETIAYLERHSTENSAEEEILNRYELNQSAIDRWFEEQEDKYPSSVEQETLETQVRRNFLLGEFEVANGALSRWEAAAERHAETLRTLRYWHSQLNNKSKAVALSLEILKLDEPEWSKAHDTLTLVGLLRENGEIEEAWSLVVDFVEAIEEAPDLAESRLTFHLLTEVWDLALAAGPKKRAIFELGCELQEALPFVPPAVLKKGEQAWALFGDNN